MNVCMYEEKLGKMKMLCLCMCKNWKICEVTDGGRKLKFYEEGSEPYDVYQEMHAMDG